VSRSWSSALERWVREGLVDAAAAERIRAFEHARGGSGRSSRLAAIVFGFGGLLLTAGILLFVAAHWDALSPSARFSLVLAMVAVLHGAGALTVRVSAGLATTLHAAGTAALGAGIFLAGQIFHMAEHWPGALMLWSAGAAVGVWLLRQWPQVLWLALLAPAWLWGEWIAAQPPHEAWRGMTPATIGMFLIACAYLAAPRPDAAAAWRRALAWLGALALIPAGIALALATDTDRALFGTEHAEVGGAALVIAWLLAVALPLALAVFLRGREAVWMLAALAWAVIVTQISARSDAGELALFGMLALGAAGIVLWGLKDRQRLAINVGVLGFALAVLGFYFSSVFDKLGRALGLIGLGILFIGGGFALERMRRRLIGRVRSAA
jgi:uncharacterized membrane protein